ncbi:caspase family protein [Candidatus Amarolinea dominans]|uniref:caspase family protein n=1 Tax=Candidatus Amarolinea dominans TaxID=3140696 RepID=UPI001DDA424F|nr:caspase family protein [Anaerolineae bacterium]
MSRTIYALFVGIDDYLGEVNPLNGCVNDVTRMRDLLAARVTGAGDRFAPRLLVNEQVTRQGLIEAWRGHLGQAGPDDVALFYYSGHGSQEHAPPEFWDFEPERMNETLVCHDSRAAGGWDLADKELAQLISEVAANGPHFAVILDCCHSGSGTRTAEEITVRQEKAHPGVRPIASYIVTPQQVAALQGQGSGAASPARPWAAIASGRHILLAACRPEQTAKETWFPGPSGVEKRGAFSFYLQDTLQQTGAALSYRDLFKRVNALVQGRVPEQDPQLEASEPADLEQPFLGGAIPAAPAAFTLSVNKELGWVVDAGAVHGIPQPTESGETTQFALFPFDADLARLRSLEQAIGQASVVQVFPGQSLVAPMGRSGVALSTKTTYKAVVTSTPLPPLAVAFEGDPAALNLVRRALAEINGPGAPSLLVREGDGPGAEYRLLADAESGRYRIRRAAEALRFAVDTPGLDPDGARLVAQRLEHIARWVSTARLTNPATELARDAVQLEIFAWADGGELELLDIIRAAVRIRTGGWKLALAARANSPLQRHGSALLLHAAGPDRELQRLRRPAAQGRRLAGAGRQEAWAKASSRRGRLRKTIDLYIPDDLWRQGVTELRDILKLIVSTDEADATLLQQGELPVTFRPPPAKMPKRLSTLNRLMARVQTRSYGDDTGSADAYTDWTTVEVATTVVRPAEAEIVL